MIRFSISVLLSAAAAYAAACRLDPDRALRRDDGRAAARDRERRCRSQRQPHRRRRDPVRRSRSSTPQNRASTIPTAILAPGLINAHTHAPMSLLRGIADDLNLQEWLEKYIFPAEAKNVTPEFVRWGTRLACLEMLLSGTTTYRRHVLLRRGDRRGDEGVRHARRAGQTVIQFPVADAKTPADALKRDRGVHAEVQRRRTDHRRCRAACGLYQQRRHASRLPRTGEQIQRCRC